MAKFLVLLLHIRNWAQCWADKTKRKLNRGPQGNVQRAMEEAFEGKIRACFLEDVNCASGFQKKELAGKSR